VVARLQKRFREEIVKEMQKKFSIDNPMAVPTLEKVVVNMGVGEALQDIKIMDAAVADLTSITGQKPVIRRAKKAISNFKLRENAPVGCVVTLRRAKMYEFVDRLVNVALPRIRDFNGVSNKSFDKQGNYTLGISDQSIFPEIETGRIQKTQGMDISFVFNRGPKEWTLELLRQMGMPFVKDRKES
jgi:large subunit ribosomal protein L5